MILVRVVVCWSLLGLAALGCGDAGSSISFGGAQDIGLFREILQSGGIPSIATLDANGFFSEHHMPLAQPACGQNLCGHGLMAVDRDFTGDPDPNWVRVLGVGFNSPLVLADLPRTPVDIAVVIDTSGSMLKDDKIRYARDGLHKLVDELRPEDRLAIIAYAADVEVVHPLVLVDVDQLDSLHTAVDTLHPAGATNLYAGLEEGFLTLLEAAEPERSRLVILLSDGNPSAGITAVAAISEMVQGYVLDGVSLTTVSVGLDANPTLMDSLAELGAGNHYHLEAVQAVSEVFIDELAYFTSIIAWDVRLEVRLGEGYSLARAYGWDFTWDHYLNTATVRIPSVALASRAGDPQPGEGRRGGGSIFLVDLLPNRDPPGDADLRQVAEIHLIYRPAGQEASLEQVIDVRGQLDPDSLPPDGRGLYSDPEMEKPFAVLAMYRGLAAVCAAATWNYHYAAWLGEQLEGTAAAFNADFDDDDLRADLVLLAQLLRNLEDKGADPDKYEPYRGGTFCGLAADTPIRPGLVSWLLLGLAWLARRRMVD
jgi:Ca-activated chloride channel family protein